MAQTYPAFAVTSTWVDLVAQTGYTALAGQSVALQNAGGGSVYVAFTAANTAPVGARDGFSLLPSVTIQGTAAHVWVRGVGSVSVGQTD